MTTRRRVREWSDQDLEAVVATSSSWRQAAVALGLKAGSTTNIKRRATELELDFSHFVGNRRWTSEQLRRTIARYGSWPEVLSSFGLSVDRPADRRRVKGDAIRLGIDVAHLQQRSTTSELRDLLDSAEDSAALPRAAGTIAAAWLATRGFPVTLAGESRAYDLLAEFPEGIQRVQVKSTTARTGGTWTVNVGRRPYSLDKSAWKRCYDPDDIDYSFIVAGGGGLFLIPVTVLGGRTRIHLSAYREYRVGSAASLLDPAARSPTGRSPGLRSTADG